MCSSSEVSADDQSLCQDDEDEGGEGDDSSEHSGAVPAKRRVQHNGHGPAEKHTTRGVNEAGSKAVSFRGQDGMAANGTGGRIKRKRRQTAVAPPGVEDVEVEVEEQGEQDDDNDDFTAPARRSSGRIPAADSKPGSRKVQRALSSSPETPASGAGCSEQGHGLDEDGTPTSEPTDAEDLVRSYVMTNQP